MQTIPSDVIELIEGLEARGYYIQASTAGDTFHAEIAKSYQGQVRGFRISCPISDARAELYIADMEFRAA